MQSGKLSGKPAGGNIDVEHRWSEIIELWQQHQWLYTVGGFLAGLLITPLISFIGEDALLFLKSLVPEAVGIAFTVLFINALDKRREQLRRTRELQERLIRDAGSPAPPTAVNAVRELQKRGWLSGEHGLLSGEDLEYAYLQNAVLSGANLSDANMSGALLDRAQMVNTNLSGTYLPDAQLQGADLTMANLQNTYLLNANLMYAKLIDANLTNADMTSATLAGCVLRQAKLCGADLSTANLSNADLFLADLTGAILAGADLRGADLSAATLKDADLSYAFFDINTRLPDDTFWTRDTDLRQFGAQISEAATNGQSTGKDTGKTKRLSVDSIQQYIATYPAADETQEIDIPHVENTEMEEDLLEEEFQWDEDDIELFDELFQNGGEDEPITLHPPAAIPFMAELDDTFLTELEVGEFEIIEPEQSATTPDVDDTVDSLSVESYFGDADETTTDIILRGDLDMSLFKGSHHTTHDDRDHDEEET